MMLLFLSGGCQRAMFDASALPENLRAGYVVDTQSLDLSSLASPTATSQRIYVGDTLKMTVITGAEEEKPEAWPMRVGEDGSVEVPLVGPIQLAGLDLQTAQDVVRQASIERGIYRKPSVTITVESRQTNHVIVLGAVAEPGEYDLPVGNSNLLGALAVAGSVTEDADRFVEIRKPRALTGSQLIAQQSGTGEQQVSYDSPSAARTEITRVDLLTASKSPNSDGYDLTDGSVVLVRKRPVRYIHVFGLVRRPNQFELPPNQNVRLLDAIALAGGRTLSIANRVLVVRQVPGESTPALIEVSIKDAKRNSDSNLLLTDGDVVSVEETPTTFILGSLQQFIRLGVNGSVGVF